MSNYFCIFNIPAQSGAQTRGLLDPNTAQISTVTMPSFAHDITVVTSTAPSEPNMAQISATTMPSFDYENTLVASSAPSEPNMAQISSLTIPSFNYA